MKRRRKTGGTSLIEAMVAVALLAMMMLAVAGSQLAMTRAQRTTIWRERALWLADARIEGARVTGDAMPELDALAHAMLPGGAVAIESGRDGVRLAIARWRGGDAALARCGGDGGATSSSSCASVPFAGSYFDDR